MTEAPAEPIDQNLWWVLKGKLAAVRQPSAAELGTLKSLGVKAVVSLMDDSDSRDLYEKDGFPHIWLPAEGGTPPTLEHVNKFVDYVDGQCTDGAVAVHCLS